MKNRFTALLIHSIASIALAGLTLWIVFYCWYPSPLHQALGVTTLFLILLGVDVCLGPILTFIVYNPKKKHLFIDLSIIALLQIAALGYGVHAIFQGRPAYIVFSKDRFETVSPVEIAPSDMKTALSNNNDLAKASWLAPHWVAATPSKDKDRRKELLFSAALGGADWPQLPELYTPLPELKAQILKKAQTIDELRKLHHTRIDIDTVLDMPVNDAVRWLPLKSTAKNMIVLIDAQSAEVIKIVDIDPWP